jgi:hypothetical protein
LIASRFIQAIISTAPSSQSWATALDEIGFVVDFSGLRELARRLAEQFDHTFLGPVPTIPCCPPGGSCMSRAPSICG